MMKIIQLTDIHIATDGVNTHNVDVRRQLNDVLADAIDRGGARIVLTGDLCFESPDKAIYSWVREFLEHFAIPYSIIPGNHDDSHMLASCFSLKEHYHEQEKELYWMEYWEDIPVFFLDSSQGDISDKQKYWLQEKLSVVTRSPLVFMHHPPVALAVPYMDNLPPRPNTESFVSALQASSHMVHVFVGHYHVDKVAVLENAIVYATPSTYFQMGQAAQHFEIDHRRPGYRLIELHQGTVLTSTHYVAHTPLKAVETNAD